MIAARPQGSNGPFYAPNRDLGHLFPYVFKEAAATTTVVLQETCHSEQLQERLDALDALTKMFVAAYTKFLENRIEGVCVYSEILENVDKSPVFREVYTIHAAVLQQLLFAVMFSSAEFPIGSTPLTDEPLQRSTLALSMLSTLDAGTRRTVLDRWTAVGEVSENISVPALRRHLDRIQDRISAQSGK